jgi:formylglycine-generating enzyme required for sulfatase activity
MHGNVAEWCLDGLREYTEEPVTDPVGVSADARRVVRGGGFHAALHQLCTSTIR